MATNFAVEVDDPRYCTGFFKQVTNEGKYEIVGKQFAKWMTIDFARICLARFLAKRLRARIVNEFGAAVTDFDGPAQNETVTLDTNHIKSVYRDTFEGKLIEIPIVFNRSNRTFYFRFTTSPNLSDPPDRSISGRTDAECFERFVSNLHLRPYIDRFVVEPLPRSVAVTAPPPNTLMISVPVGTSRVVIAARPGNKS